MFCHRKPETGAEVAKRAVLFVAVFIVILPIVAACSSKAVAPQKEDEMKLSLYSSSFKEGDKIPVKYTCDGQNTSPPLSWDEQQQQTQALTLIMDDPDAPSGVFTHWVLFNIPANTWHLAEGVPPSEQLENGALQGKNGGGRFGYTCPCPPRGPAHRYVFTLYALDRRLDLKAGASKSQVLDAMKGHVLAQHQLVGTYQR